ncbi:MAG: LysR family transcriptional regulator [Oscillospiraceae bacterium]|jgi:transcriptional regulator|nr:LysR family transcriptional regulator [Oscillospiraceae bacterium]
MNTQYFIYAIEVEKTGSITQAANNLFMSQPTLSKAIRDMESSVGFPVFKRTSKGVVPTQRGTEFLIYAKKIAAQLQKMDAILHAQDTSHQLFSLAIPRVSYIAQAASEYVCTFDNQRDMEVDILETSSMRVIDSVAYGHYVLGIIRYHTEDEDYFLKSLAEAGLQYELLWQSGYVALMRHDHPLAQREQLTARDFDPYVEIAFGDEEVPYIRVSESKACSCFLRSSKRILVYDRATQFDLLRANPCAYMWVSPLPDEVLRSNGLTQRKCHQNCQFKDLIISRAGYRFSRLDREFIDRLCLQRNKVAFSV